ncbi:MAG TPA: hypothetical protein VGX25_03945 [Actinophytocola sp.]|uniref:hypothetical protein n=1 Tax=Actinophytocola sp. TaxID=1872138 RepID=UPI002DDCB8C8|nr:hypothetical protein [Actinophytocola sp.]HEV2778530.1 hypothetical protein [Actinophytocola sp.]
MTCSLAKNLFAAWRDGAVILAGTGVARPVYLRERVALDCREPRCHTTVFGDTATEAAGRLANHRMRCHQ